MAEAAVRLGTRSHDGAHANSVAKSFACPRAEARERALPRRVHSGRSRDFDGGAALSGWSRPRPQSPSRAPRGPEYKSTCRSVLTRRPSSRELPPTDGPPKRFASARHAVWEFDDNSLEVRLLSTFAAKAIVASDYLSDTVRSQGFSPSQRFDPARASWPCFVPHPPLGFWPPELFPLSQPLHLSMPVALLSFWPTPAPFEQARTLPLSLQVGAPSRSLTPRARPA